MRVLIAPDSFKGAIDAPSAAAAIARGLHRVWPDADCVLLPVADGGEGTLEALLAAAAGERVTTTVTGPLGNPVRAAYGLLADGETAVIEMAQAAGLSLVPPELRDPKRTTTYGVGELIRQAGAKPGVRRLLIGLGGSATNDGGAGILQALGIALLDGVGQALPTGGAALINLTTVDRSAVPTDRSDLEIRIACDVDNPLTGPRGASTVFGPQKGATPADIELLDNALAHYASVLGIDPARPGSGAAGGTTAGLLYLFPQARLQPGIDFVLDALHFDDHLTGADLVITGEGRLDSQTLGGKAIAGVARRARARSVPVAALVGSLAADLDLDRLASDAGVSAVLPLAPGPCTLDESMANTAIWLENAAERAAGWIAIGSGIRIKEGRH